MQFEKRTQQSTLFTIVFKEAETVLKQKIRGHRCCAAVIPEIKNVFIGVSWETIAGS